MDAWVVCVIGSRRVAVCAVGPAIVFVAAPFGAATTPDAPVTLSSVVAAALPVARRVSLPVPALSCRRRRRVCVRACGLAIRVCCGIGAVGERALLARVRRGWLGDARPVGVSYSPPREVM